MLAVWHDKNDAESFLTELLAGGFLTELLARGRRVKSEKLSGTRVLMFAVHAGKQRLLRRPFEEGKQQAKNKRVSPTPTPPVARAAVSRSTLSVCAQLPTTMLRTLLHLGGWAHRLEMEAN